MFVICIVAVVLVVVVGNIMNIIVMILFGCCLICGGRRLAVMALLMDCLIHPTGPRLTHATYHATGTNRYYYTVAKAAKADA